MRISLASTRTRWIRSMNPHPFEYAVNTASCGRSNPYIFEYVDVTVSDPVFTARPTVYSLDTCGLEANPHRKSCGFKNNRRRVDGLIRFEYATCGGEFVLIRIEKVVCSSMLRLVQIHYIRPPAWISGFLLYMCKSGNMYRFLIKSFGLNKMYVLNILVCIITRSRDQWRHNKGKNDPKNALLIVSYKLKLDMGNCLP